MNTFVCISHLSQWPCNAGEYHLLSNWPADIKKVVDNISEPRYYIYN